MVPGAGDGDADCGRQCRVSTPGSTALHPVAHLPVVLLQVVQAVVLVVLVVLAEDHTLKAGTLMEEALDPTEEDQITHPHITTEVIDAN